MIFELANKFFLVPFKVGISLHEVSLHKILKKSAIVLNTATSWFLIDKNDVSMEEWNIHEFLLYHRSEIILFQPRLSSPGNKWILLSGIEIIISTITITQWRKLVIAVGR